MFFFSSRRRHTRWNCDWSSDVCSSDLTAYHILGLPIFVRGSEMRHVDKSGTFNRLMIAQDVGSAIKGPERGDIYFGSGDAEIGRASCRERGWIWVAVVVLKYNGVPTKV